MQRATVPTDDVNSVVKRSARPDFRSLPRAAAGCLSAEIDQVCCQCLRERRLLDSRRDPIGAESRELKELTRRYGRSSA